MTYEQARDRCRQAWSKTQMQLSFDVLEEAVDGNSAASSSASAVDSPSFSEALQAGVGPGCGLIADAYAATANDFVSFPAPSTTNGGSAADSWTGQRGAPAKGVSHR